MDHNRGCVFDAGQRRSRPGAWLRAGATVLLSFVIVALAGAQAGPSAVRIAAEKQALEKNREGWLVFQRSSHQRQLGYVALLMWRCAIDEVRYSLGNDALDRRLELPPCDPSRPAAMPEGAVYALELARPYDHYAIQLHYRDGTRSDVVRGALESVAPLDLLASKVGIYTECYNRFVERVPQSRESYLRLLKDPARGPTGRERRLALREIPDPAECLARIRATAEEEPNLGDTDAAALAWVRSVSSLHETLREGHRYYELENHKDDGLARGRALHAELLASWSDYDERSRVLIGQITPLLDRIQEASLERLAAAGPTLAYHLQLFMSRAETVLDAARVRQLEEIEMAGFAAAVEQCEASWNELAAYARERLSSTDQTRLESGFFKDAVEFLKSAKTLMRRLRDGNGFSRRERSDISAGYPERVAGHPAQLLETYNDLVQALSWVNRVGWPSEASR